MKRFPRVESRSAEFELCKEAITERQKLLLLIKSQREQLKACFEEAADFMLHQEFELTEHEISLAKRTVALNETVLKLLSWKKKHQSRP